MYFRKFELSEVALCIVDRKVRSLEQNKLNINVPFLLVGRAGEALITHSGIDLGN